MNSLLVNGGIDGTVLNLVIMKCKSVSSGGLVLARLVLNLVIMKCKYKQESEVIKWTKVLNLVIMKCKYGTADTMIDKISKFWI